MDRKMQTDRRHSLNPALHHLVQEFTTFIAACYAKQCRKMTTENMEEKSRENLKVCS